VAAGVNNSGLSNAIVQPNFYCGTGGSIAERLLDCAAKNPYTSEYKSDSDILTYWWQLVSRRPNGILWRDNLTGLIWSDVISTNENWCRSSGSNYKESSPWREIDTYCSNASYQGITNPVSFCAEDSVNLSGSVLSHVAKGGLGNLYGATTPFTWWLPELEDFRTAFAHGAKFVLPRFSERSWWTASIDSRERRFAWVFGNNGEVVIGDRCGDSGVRCVGSE
jgi:hypothetical protein